MNSNAVFSLSRKYRYRLNRRINQSRKEIIFIGLNPSTADETKNDPDLQKEAKKTSEKGIA